MVPSKPRRTLYLLCLLLISFVLFVVAGRDCYKILGIRRNATEKEIKKAFRKLSLKYHPDQNPSEEAKTKYLDINFAYETLSDPEKRKLFDQFGEDGVNQHAQQQAQGGGHNPFGGGFPFGGGGGGFQFHTGGGGGGADPFSFFFGGGGQQRQQQQRYPQGNIYDKDTNVIELNGVNWPFHRTESEEDKATIWFINFYSDQCSHCHQVAATYKAVAKETRGLAKVAAINCAKEANICKQQGINQYPTFKVFGYHKHNDPQVFNPQNHEKKTFVEFIHSSIPNFIKTQTSVLTFLDMAVLGPYLPQVIILAPSNRTPLLSPQLISLAKNFHTSFRFFAIPTPKTKDDPEFQYLISWLDVPSNAIPADPTKITKPLFFIKTPTKTTPFTGNASFKELTSLLTKTRDEFKEQQFYTSGFGDFILQTRGLVLNEKLLLSLQNNPSAGYLNTFITCDYLVDELTHYEGFNKEKPTESKFSPLLPWNAQIENIKEANNNNDGIAPLTKPDSITPQQMAYMLFEILQTTTKTNYFVSTSNTKMLDLLQTIMGKETIAAELAALQQTCRSTPLANKSTQQQGLSNANTKQPVIVLGLNLKRNRLTTLVQQDDVDLWTYMGSIETFVENNETTPSNSIRFAKPVKVAMGLESSKEEL